MSREITYNWTLKPGHVSFNDPEYDGANPYFPAPPLTAFGNIQYLEMIDLIKEWWEGTHPEIEVQGIQNDEVYNPDHAYILHTLLDRRAHERTPKPKLHKEVLDSAEGKVYLISTMSFVNIVQFTAVHRDPKIADRIIEEFQSFILFEATPILKKLGIEDIRFGNRMKDSTIEMKGEDLSARHVTFRVVAQEVLYSTLGRLEELYIIAQTRMTNEFSATPSIPGIIEMVLKATDPEDE